MVNTYEQVYKDLCQRIKLNCGVEREIRDILQEIIKSRQDMETELAKLDLDMDSIAYLDNFRGDYE